MAKILGLWRQTKKSKRRLSTFFEKFKAQHKWRMGVMRSVVSSQVDPHEGIVIRNPMTDRDHNNYYSIFVDKTSNTVPESNLRPWVNKARTIFSQKQVTSFSPFWATDLRGELIDRIRELLTDTKRGGVGKLDGQIGARTRYAQAQNSIPYSLVNKVRNQLSYEPRCYLEPVVWGYECGGGSRPAVTGANVKHIRSVRISFIRIRFGLVAQLF